MAGELLNELQTICTQGAIEESGEKIERRTAVRISLRRVCHLANLQFPVIQTKRSDDRIPTR